MTVSTETVRMAKSRPRKDQSKHSDLPCQIIISDIPQFLLGNIRPRDAFRPIARERKYLIDYNSRYPLATTVRTKNWQYNDIKTLRHKDIRKDQPYLYVIMFILLRKWFTLTICRYDGKVTQTKKLPHVECFMSPV